MTFISFLNGVLLGRLKDNKSVVVLPSNKFDIDEKFLEYVKVYNKCNDPIRYVVLSTFIDSEPEYKLLNVYPNMLKDFGVQINTLARIGNLKEFNKLLIQNGITQIDIDLLDGKLSYLFNNHEDVIKFIDLVFSKKFISKEPTAEIITEVLSQLEQYPEKYMKDPQYLFPITKELIDKFKNALSS